MQSTAMHTPLKIVALVVLLLMWGAALYSGYMAIDHWTGIGV